jgi:hypothetical protein
MPTSTALSHALHSLYHAFRISERLMFFNHGIQAHQGREGALAALESLQGFEPDVTNKFTDGQALLGLASPYRTWHDGWYYVVIHRDDPQR